MGHLMAPSFCLFLTAVILQPLQCTSSSLYGIHVHPSSCDLETNSLHVSGSGGDFTENTVSLDTALENLESNTILFLASGTHCVRTYHGIVLINKRQVSIQGESSEEVTITCQSGIGLSFLGFYDFVIQNVTIDQCGSRNEFIYHFLYLLHTHQKVDIFFTILSENISQNNIALMIGDCENLRMSDVVIKNTQGLGLLGINIIGKSKLTHLVLIHNAPQSTNRFLFQVGGGALILYHDYSNCSSGVNENVSQLTIRDSIFLSNVFVGRAIDYIIHNRLYSDRLNDTYFFGSGGGLSITMTQYNYRVNVTMGNCLFQNNTAQYGSGLLVAIFAGVLDSHVIVADSVFKDNGISEDMIPDPAYYSAGAGLTVFLDISRPEMEHFEPLYIHSNTLVIVRSNFTRNIATSGTGLVIYSFYFPVAGISEQHTVIVDSCIINENLGLSYPALFAQELKAVNFQPGIHLILHNTKIINNSLISLRTGGQQIYPIIQFVTINVTISGDTEISENGGTGISLEGSGLLTFHGNIHIRNNVAMSFGGGMKINPSWIVLIKNNTHLHFTNNSATVYGGGMYSSPPHNSPGTQTSSCFLYWERVSLFCFGQLSRGCSSILNSLNASITFNGNMSPLGSMIYGTTFEDCPWAIYLRQKYPSQSKNETLLEILDKNKALFYFSSPPRYIDEVSTPTVTVSIDNPEGEEIDVMPGQVFYVSVKTLDGFNRFVPTVLSTSSQLPIYSLSDGVSAKIGQSNYYFIGNNTSSQGVPVQLFGAPKQTPINVSLVTVESFAQSQFVVNLINCSEGFEYINNFCTCSKEIEENNLNCSTEGNFLVPPDLWIGKGPDESLFITGCNFDYCLNGLRTISPSNYSAQCNEGYNRQGISCGQCQTNYSITFGSNICEICTNTGLFLLLVIAIVGIIVIFLIGFLQITVSDGLLNGAIFFSNITVVYIPIFLNTSDFSPAFILQKWLNLNIGIKLCFFNGMDSLIRSYLSVVFPIYLYVLMAVIIILAKKSNRFSTYIYRQDFSPTKLFATLIVMTYSSLLQTCIEVLGFTSVTTFKGNQYYLWRLDRNQQVFNYFHAPLGVTAILMTIFFIILVPVLLIFPILQVKPLIRFLPLYDAFWAPFKPKYRFWVGLRLVLRVFPFIFAHFFVFPVNLICLILFVLMLIYVQGLIQPFKSSMVNALDSLLLIVIIMFAAGAMFFNTIYPVDYTIIEGTDFTLGVLETMSVFFPLSLAYMVFMYIFAWHIFKRFPKLKVLPKKICNTYHSVSQWTLSWKIRRKRKNMDSSSVEPENNTSNAIPSIVTTSDVYINGDASLGNDERISPMLKTVRFSQFRESLLETTEAFSTEIIGLTATNPNLSN